MAPPQDTKMEIPEWAQHYFSKGLLLLGKEETHPRAEGRRWDSAQGLRSLGRKERFAREEE